jgi:hypothetical protein
LNLDPIRIRNTTEFSAKCRVLSQDRGAGGARQPEVSAVRRAAAPQRRGVPGGRGQGPPPALPVPHGQEGPRRRPRHQVHTIRSSCPFFVNFS